MNFKLGVEGDVDFLVGVLDSGNLINFSGVVLGKVLSVRDKTALTWRGTSLSL